MDRWISFWLMGLTLGSVLACPCQNSAHSRALTLGSAAAKTADEVIATFGRDWDAQPGYMRRLDDRGWKARMVALCELVKLGPQAAPALVQALDDDNADVRVFATQCLGFVADGSAAEKMEKVLAKDPEPAARLYAADALGMFGGMKPKPLYSQVEENDPNRDVRPHVRFALERHGERLPASVQEQFVAFDLQKMDTARIGELAPDFILTDALGETYRLSSFRGKKAVVLVFIYGDT